MSYEKFTNLEKSFVLKKLKMVTEYPIPEDWNKINFFWDNDMNCLDSIGVFKWWKTNTIIICGEYKNDEYDVIRLVPTIAHELTHRRQFKKLNIIFMIFFVFFRNTFEMEPEAWEKMYNDKFEIPENERL